MSCHRSKFRRADGRASLIGLGERTSLKLDDSDAVQAPRTSVLARDRFHSSDERDSVLLAVHLNHEAEQHLSTGSFIRPSLQTPIAPALSYNFKFVLAARRGPVAIDSGHSVWD